MKRRILVLLTAALAFLPVSAAPAGTGDTLREITAADPQSCTPFNVGLAFDGTNLLVSCVGSGVIDKIDPSDGSLVGQITVAGESVLGALSYDRTRGKLWACTFGGAERVMLIDPADGSKDAEFASNGCGDGLAYDGDDDTLWAGADQVCDVTHYETDGTVIGAFNVCPLIGGSGKSGIAVGGGKLYVASPSLSRVYEVEKDFSASSLLFQTNRFLEDLECDDVTFAPKSAMWIQAAFDRILTAVEIPAGACPFGGGPLLTDLAITKADAPDPVALGGSLTYTLTVTNNGPDPSTDSTVTDTLPPGVTFVSATPSQGACSQAAGTVTCTLGPLALGGSATIQIVVTVEASALSPLSDTATVTGVETDPLAANNSATAETTISLPTALDHFKCYKTRQVGTKFDPRRVVLTDQFTTERVNVVRPEAFCNPVDKDGSGINDPSAHLACYKIHDVRGDEFPKFKKERVDVTDQFGTHSLLLKKTRSLCLPASKAPLGEVPGAPPPGLDHFKCYKTRQVGTKFDPRQVVLSDQFTTERVNVVRPEAFCTPVDKDGSGINDPSAHLACYKIRDVRGDEFPKFERRRLEVGDQFGTHSLLLKKTRTLCLPSSKTVL